ncbi:hypothetical protein ccbrp13_35900 [Ktedonobacteria bacterium brp13]|nr:hypothetical protein ccbrp13_35900 [Ktedonobacteria bacterium brp13]
MNNQALPAHEFFIYVPSLHDCDDELAGQPFAYPDDRVPQQVGLIDLSSWTRIDIAGSVALYARLNGEQQEQALIP